MGNCFNTEPKINMTTIIKPLGKKKNASVLTNYNIIKQIGNGAFSNVWKAEDIISGDTVALKISTGNIENLTLEKEFYYLRSMNHKNIIAPIKFFYDRRLPTYPTYMVIPFMKKDLYTHVIDENNHMSNEDLKKIIQDIGNAIKHMHSKNIVHRDIKPENIMIDHGDNYILCDFGGVEHEDLISSKHLIGSTPYMAPEFIVGYINNNSNNLALGKPGDIYSFGMTLYNMASRSMGGPSPNNKTNLKFIQEITHYDMTDRINELEHPESFKNMLQFMLCRSPIQRLTIDEVLNHPFMIDHIDN